MIKIIGKLGIEMNYLNLISNLYNKNLLSLLPLKVKDLDFLGGTVVKNPPANSGDMGSIPGLGRSHMPRSN